MQTDDTKTTEAAFAKWFHKPLRRWWYTIDFSVAAIVLVAAFVTQIWWLLFISALALMESVCIYIVGIFTDVVHEKDAEIDRLRRQLSALLSEIA